MDLLTMLGMIKEMSFPINDGGSGGSTGSWRFAYVIDEYEEEALDFGGKKRKLREGELEGPTTRPIYKWRAKRNR
ncbi:U3 small nucleolar RNA-associated protein 11 [Asimina triloba]